MATVLTVGDIAIVQYNSSTGAFSFVFLRDVEAGTAVNFTDNGWLAAGGFRPGEDTVTYTAPAAIAAGVVTLSGLTFDTAGDQIIPYQGDPATPTILHVIDFGDGNNTVAGDATDDNTTALPPGFTLGVNAVAIAFDQSLYAGATSGSPAELFAVVNNPGNWIDSVSLSAPFASNAKPSIDLDSNNSTHGGRDYETAVASGGPGVPVADTDIAIDDDDDRRHLCCEIKVNGKDPEDFLAVAGSLPAGIVATAYNPATGILRLDGRLRTRTTRRRSCKSGSAPPMPRTIRSASRSRSSTASSGVPKALRLSTSEPTGSPPTLDLDADNSTMAAVQIMWRRSPMAGRQDRSPTSTSPLLMPTV